MRWICLGLVAVSLMAQQPRPWWPQDYTVERDDAEGRLVLSTPYYTIEHDLNRGGVVSKIHLTHGRAENLLVTPMAASIKLLGTERGGSQWRRRSPPVRDTYADVNDAAPVVSHRRLEETEVVTVESRLLGEDGKESGFRLKTTYRYRWGYVKIRREFVPPTEPQKVRSMTVLSTTLHPSLADYGYRPAVGEEMGSNPHSWSNGQIRRWGKMRPGSHFDLPFRTRHVPRYIVLANMGIEGLEWFVSDDLSQWDYQLTGQPGTGYCHISATSEPLGIRFAVDALNLSAGYFLPKGGYVEPKQPAVFDYYIGIPVKAGHANRPWLHESMRGVRNHEGQNLTEADIRQWAANGIREVTLHDDGDRQGDGVFWRDGSYPPYPPKVMKRMDGLIAMLHRNGIRVAPYFSNHELHQSTDEYTKYAHEWARKPDDQGNIRPNYYYGAHMCLKSGWLDYLKHCVDRALTNHEFDGAYFDWNIAMYCNNPLHVGKRSNEVSGEKGLGALALSPTGHWDIDELIELVEWTRQRVGKEGLFILHNTLVPMFTTENFADHVVGMEFGYAKAFSAMPKVTELPLEWSFAGARSRAVIVQGCVDSDAPARTFRLHALTGLMTAVTPWRANEPAIEFVKVLRPLGDIEQYEFEDWRNTAVQLEGDNCISALYSRQGEAYILLANFSPEPKTVLCRLKPNNLPYRLTSIRTAEVARGERRVPLDAAKLTGSGERIEIGADDVVLLHVQ